MKKKPILIDVYKSESRSEIVRLHPDTMMLVRQIQRETGLSASCLVSQVFEKAIQEYGIELNFIPIKEENDA